MDAEKCSVCGDDLLPDEVGVCWQCEGQIGDPVGVIALPMSAMDRWIAALLALLAYCMMMGAM